MPHLGKIARAVPEYIRQFGWFDGVRIGLLTVPPKVLPRHTLTRIQLPGARGPVWLRARTSDVKVFHQIFVEGDHELTLTRHPEVIVDAGANVGYSSIHFALRYPEARVIAVEPDPGNFQALLRNAQPYPSILPVQGAVWSHRTTLAVENPLDQEWAFRVTDAPTAPENAVQAYSITDLLNLACVDHVDILKVDIEGAEIELFQEPGLAWLPRIGVLLIEFHDYLRPGCRSAVEKALAGLALAQSRQGEYCIFAAPDWCS